MTFDKKKYDQAYVKDKYDRIPINVPKGDREKILNHAKNKGYKSINEYIKDLINKDMNQGNKTVNVRNVNQIGDNNSINIG